MFLAEVAFVAGFLATGAFLTAGFCNWLSGSVWDLWDSCRYYH